MIKDEHQIAPQPAPDEAAKLAAPTTLDADQLEVVAAGVSAALFPGRPGPVNGIVQAEK